MLDVVVDRVAEDQRLHDRDEDDHAQRDPVAPELQELLPGQRQQPLHDATRPFAARLPAGERDEHVLERRLGLPRVAESAEERTRLRLAPAADDDAQPHAEEIRVLEGSASSRMRASAANGSPAVATSKIRPSQVRLQIVRRALGDERPVEDEGQAVALLGLVHVVRRHEHRHAPLRGELVDQVPEEPPAAGVDAARRLVEEEQLRLVQERGGERHALPLAGREGLGHRSARSDSNPRRAASVRDPLLQPRGLEAVDRAEEAQVLLDREVEVERELLAHVAEAPLPLLGVPGHVETAEADGRARARLEQAREHPDRRRLARAVGPEEAEDAAAGHVEADGVDGREVAEAARQPARLQEGLRDRGAHAATPSSSLFSTKTSSRDGESVSTSSGGTRPASCCADRVRELVADARRAADVEPRAEERHVVDLRAAGEALAHVHAVRGPHDEKAPRIGRHDLLARPERRQPPLVEEADARGVLRLVHVGRRDQDRQPFVVELVQEPPELAPRDRVDARSSARRAAAAAAAS